MDLLRKALTPPFLIQANDYHDFDNIQRVLRIMHPEIKVTELDHAYDVKTKKDLYIYYIAVVHFGDVPSNEEVNEINKKQEWMPVA